MKDKLPDDDADSAGGFDGGVDGSGETSIAISFDFILNNFVESMRLWSRIQTGSGARDRTRREKEKQELRTLVTANLMRLSQLDGLTWEFYRDTALPKLLEQLVGTKDAYAQQYLLDSIIQVFPDDYHLYTLEKVLDACSDVQPGVDLKQVMINLMKRLSRFVSGKKEQITGEVDIFNIFWNRLRDMVERPGGVLEIGDVLELQGAFMSFMITLYPTRLDYCDTILATTEGCVLRYQASQAQAGHGLSEAMLDQKAVTKAVDILTAPVNTDLKLMVFSLESYKNLFSLLQPSAQRSVSQKVAQIIVEKNIEFTDEIELQRLTHFLTPLVVFQPDVTQQQSQFTNFADLEPQEEDLVEDMEAVCRIIHRVKSDNLDGLFRMCTEFRKYLGPGGFARLKMALPPLLYKILDAIPKVRKHEIDCQNGVTVAREIPGTGGAGANGAVANGTAAEPIVNVDGTTSPAADGSATSPHAANPPQVEYVALQPLEFGTKKYFQFLHKTLSTAFNKNPATAILAVQFWLKGAALANAVDGGTGQYSELLNEFVDQAITVFEEEIKESRDQFKGITLIVQVLCTLDKLNEEQYGAFAGRLTRAAVQLTKKAHQAKGLQVCAHMFWNNQRQMGAQTLQCLKRCLQVATEAAQQNPLHVVLFLELLESYIYYLEKRCPDVTVGDVNLLVQVCRAQVAELSRRTEEYGGGNAAQDCNEYFGQILKYLTTKRAEPEWAELDQSVLMG